MDAGTAIASHKADADNQSAQITQNTTASVPSELSAGRQARTPANDPRTAAPADDPRQAAVAAAAAGPTDAADKASCEASKPVLEKDEEEDVPYKPFAKLLADGPAGDVRYRQARIRSRGREPTKPPPVEDPAEEAELRAVWADEWFGFPLWDMVLFAKATLGHRRWRQLSNDKRRAACERFTLCGPWAATQEPDAANVAAMQATSNSRAFIFLDHPARQELFFGAFAIGHGLARIAELKSDRPHDPGTWDSHVCSSTGEKLTTAEICYRIVVPATRAYGASYVDLYLGDDLWGEGRAPAYRVAGGAQEGGGKGTGRDTGRPRFLSHAWGCPFMQLVTVAFVEGTPPMHDPGPFWIDIFCKNQHVPIKESDLTDNINASKGVTLAVWPWPAPLLINRVWCLFEILNAVQTKTKLELKLLEGAYSSFRGQLRGKYNGFTYSRVRDDVTKYGLSHLLPGASELIEAVDVRQAQATVAADKDMILRLIERDLGSADMNQLVREMLTAGLTDATALVVEAVVGEDRMGYVSYQGGWD